MKNLRMLGMIAFFMVWPLLCQATPAAAFFSKDITAPYWDNQEQVPVQPPVTPKSYQVQQGDTLWSLALNQGLNLGTLAEVNGITSDSILHPGQTLVLPSATDSKHRVVAGENLWSLAQRYHVSLSVLMASNQISDPSSLSEGQELVIPNQVADSNRSAASSNVEASGDIVLSWPLVGQITSNFGPRGGGFHHGLDIAGNTGDSIRAAQQGRVSYLGWLPYYGWTVIVDYNHSYRILYGHISRFLTAFGDQVKQGQIIACVGSSGNATGPHLHFELRLNDRAIDPLPHLKGSI
jgi:murein DD-endopeptidase MepM/ murein hydrolase activator NlpD